MKNQFKMGILPVFLAILPLLTQAQIKIEAEDYLKFKV